MDLVYWEFVIFSTPHEKNWRWDHDSIAVVFHDPIEEIFFLSKKRNIILLLFAY